MDSKVNILDSQTVKQFGQNLSCIADECGFVDLSVVQAYAKAEEDLAQAAYSLRQELEQAKSRLAQTENDEERESIKSEVADLAKRVNVIEQTLHEAKGARRSYEERAQEMQADFSCRAQKVGSVLVSYIEGLEASSQRG